MFLFQSNITLFFHPDVDECSGGTHDCSSPEETCMNTVGSFTCECSNGYVQDGATCIGMYKLLVLF